MITATAFFLAVVWLPAAFAADAAKIDQKAHQALENLLLQNTGAIELSDVATAVLVFPDIVKVGFLIGGQRGDGALIDHDGTSIAYYRSLAASYGLQAGIQKFGYALFFMTQDALDYLDKSGGWEIGVGPSVVVVDAGIAKTLTSTTVKSDIYAFVFDQSGLMAGAGIQGTKITRIDPD